MSDIDRAANHSIKGFLYQFHKTALELLSLENDTDYVHVEGVIEVDSYHFGKEITATQYKYHETVESYTLSQIYKPLLQIMARYNKEEKIQYRLFAHFKSETPRREKINEILNTKNSKLEKLVNKGRCCFE